MSNGTAVLLGLGVVGVGVALALAETRPRGGASSSAPVLNIGAFIDGAASLLGKINFSGGGGQPVIAGSVQNGVGVSSQGGGLVDVDRDSLSDLWDLERA